MDSTTGSIFTLVSHFCLMQLIILWHGYFHILPDFHCFDTCFSPVRNWSKSVKPHVVTYWNPWSESKLSSWFHGVHLYDSIFNWKRQRFGYLKHVEVVSLCYQSCWLCWQSFGTKTLTIWNERRDFQNQFVLGYKCVQMVAKHSLESQAH